MWKRGLWNQRGGGGREYSNSFDLLFRGTELVSGGQRLHRYGEYLAALEKAHLPVEPFESYLEAFKYGMPPHGGFRLGLYRLLTQMARRSQPPPPTFVPRYLLRPTA